MTRKKAEIQGLRAIAVVSVVFFHIWPDLVPGGYVGVDVFFVISGYLITAHLFREAQSRGTISLLGFYERRVRRLLPAATFVVMAIAAATPLLLPQARWEETAFEIAASALYVENWRLAWLAVDYLGAENTPSPVQHYWSLSIEEQFYIVWPLVIFGGCWLAMKIGRLRATLFTSLALIAASSLAASVVVTGRDQQAAYFVTHTRIWELALGGLLALMAVPGFSPATKEAMRILGLAAIVIACFAFTKETAFPGYAALLPTVGCALVIAAGTGDGRFSSYRLLALRPAQFVGDISYSIYLWHWPLIVFALMSADGSLSTTAGLVVAALSVAIASLSKWYIEDPFRQPGRPSKAIGYSAASIAGCVAASGLIVALVGVQQSGFAVAATSPALYPGASAMLAGVAVPAVDQFMPPLAAVKKDIPEGYRSGCHLGIKERTLNPCIFGRPDAPFRAILAGDSHAANWIPAMEELARSRDWRVETHTKSGCPLLTEATTLRGKPYTACAEWGEALIAHIAKTKPNVIILSQSAGAKMYDEKTTVVSAIVRTWRKIIALGMPVVAVADTPRHAFNPAECIEKDRRCASPRKSALRADPILKAQKIEPRVALIDMNDGLCTETQCLAIIGNIVAWRDTHHLTATYSRSLAQALGDRVAKAIGN